MNKVTLMKKTCPLKVIKKSLIISCELLKKVKKMYINDNDL